MDCCMQVAVGCGSICIFHVGGAADGDASSNRWEFFIGNHHMTTGNLCCIRFNITAHLNAELHSGNLTDQERGMVCTGDRPHCTQRGPR